MKRTVTAILVLGVLLLNSCGGSSSTQVAGIDGTGVAYGPITGFGSIFVNGVEYSTSNAQITLDDDPGTESQLYAGDIVTVNGTVNHDGKTGTATQVTFSGELAGPVTQLNTTAGTFVILGQTVVVSGSTLFDDNLPSANITALSNGTLVEVSGFPNASGQIVASRIQLQSQGAALQVKGTVQALDTNAHTFQLNSLVVDYGSAMVTGTLSNGSSVKVKGSGTTSGGALTAASVRVLAGLGGKASQNGQVEGYVTGFTSNTSFAVNGQQVTTNSSTQFNLGGITLGLNVRVEVEGSFDAAGVLVAKTVVARPDGAAMVAGLVESASAAAGTLSVLGVNVTTDIRTVFQDKSTHPPLHLFNLNNVQIGDYVLVRGTVANGGLSAKILVREQPDRLSHLQGTVTSVGTVTGTGSGTLTVFGVVTVATGPQTSFVLKNGKQVDPATFYGQVANQTVTADGTLVTGTFTASRIQITGG